MFDVFGTCLSARDFTVKTFIILPLFQISAFKMLLDSKIGPQMLHSSLFNIFCCAVVEKEAAKNVGVCRMNICQWCLFPSSITLSVKASFNRTAMLMYSSSIGIPFENCFLTVFIKEAVERNRFLQRSVIHCNVVVINLCLISSMQIVWSVANLVFTCLASVSCLARVVITIYRL